MGTNELGAFDWVRTDKEVDISYEVLYAYLDSIKRTYQQAGLDPANSGRNCPGFKNADCEFQVKLEQTVNGEIVGSHYSFSSTETGLVQEGDIFLCEGECDLTEERILTPESSVMESSPLDTESTQWLIAYIEDNLAEGCFTAVEYKNVLTTSQ